MAGYYHFMFLFPYIVKMAADYAKVDKIGSFTTNSTCSSEIFAVLLWNIDNLKSLNKNNKCFLIKKNPEILLNTKKLHRSAFFLP